MACFLRIFSAMLNMMKCFSKTALIFGVLTLAWGSPANAVPITVLAEGPGTSTSSGPGTVTFTISYAPGLPGDIQTLNSAIFTLRTPGHDTNAFFLSNAAVASNPYGILYSFDNANVASGILKVNFNPLYFDSGESFAFTVDIGELCAGCGSVIPPALPNSGGAIGSNAVTVAFDIAGLSTYSGTFGELSSTTASATVSPVSEPGTLLLMGSGLAGLGAGAWRRHRRH